MFPCLNHANILENSYLENKGLDVAFLFRATILPPAAEISKPTKENNVVDIVD